jgi:SPP1 gp7 family putative phage head morphogenesis protein
MDLQGGFDLAPKKALQWFRAKGYNTTFAWQDAWKSDHADAFTVAKMANVDLLRDVRMAVDKAMASGQSFEQFRKELEPVLVDAGWWGHQEVIDPLTQQAVVAELGSVRRLRIIYQVNMQTSYAAGAWDAIQETKGEAGLLMYDAIDDERTREEHRAWDGIILPVDDPWWSSHYPPNGWNCRCSVIQLTAEQAEAEGYKGAAAPEVKTREYTNPRTGEVSQVPIGIDSGFDYNVGTVQHPTLQQQLEEKQKALRDGR